MSRELVERHLGPHEVFRWSRMALYQARQLKARDLEVRILLRHSRLQANIDHPSHAVGTARIALALANELGDLHSSNHARILLGEGLTLMGSLDEAIDLLRHGIGIARDQRDVRAEAYALIGLANAISDLDSAAASGFLRAGAELLQGRLQDPVSLLYKTHYQSETVLSIQTDDAVTRYSQLLQQARHGGDPQFLRDTLIHLSRAYQMRSNFGGALATAQEAVAVATDLGDIDILSGAIWDVAVAHRGLGHMTEALRDGERAVELIRGRDHPAYPRLLELLALWQAEKGDIMNSPPTPP